MKLVIDIPDKIYKELTETAIIVTEAYPSTIERALTEGIVLPKGHGRLIDADTLEKRLTDDMRDADKRCDYYRADKIDTAADYVADTETIIEADKEGAD